MDHRSNDEVQCHKDRTRATHRTCIFGEVFWILFSHIPCDVRISSVYSQSQVIHITCTWTPDLHKCHPYLQTWRSSPVLFVHFKRICTTADLRQISRVSPEIITILPVVFHTGGGLLSSCFRHLVQYHPQISSHRSWSNRDSSSDSDSPSPPLSSSILYLSIQNDRPGCGKLHRQYEKLRRSEELYAWCLCLLQENKKKYPRNDEDAGWIFTLRRTKNLAT